MENGTRLWWEPRGRATRVFGFARVPVVFLKQFRYRNKPNETALVEEAHNGCVHEIRTEFLFRVSDSSAWESAASKLRASTTFLNSRVTVGDLIRELERDKRYSNTIDAVIIAAQRLVPGHSVNTVAHGIV